MAGNYIRKSGEHVEFILGGHRYRWQGWYGCQLASREWRRPPAGTTRDIVGRQFHVFTTTRRGWKIDVTWCLNVGTQHLEKEVPALRAELQGFV